VSRGRLSSIHSVFLFRLNSKGTQILIATSAGDVHQLDLLTFDHAHLSSCHPGPVRAVAFPKDLDAVLATCAEDGVRLWSLPPCGRGRPVLRAAFNGAACLAFSPDGDAIHVGFDDGAVRALAPESGRLLYCSGGAHPSGKLID